MICPQCSSDRWRDFAQDRERSYQLCEDCHLVFVPRSLLITQADERTRYENHNNDPADPRYEAYLSQTADLITPHLFQGSVGLDFGSGSSTLLGELMQKRGYPCDSFDLYFHPDQALLRRSYDFVILSEVIEHLRDPKVELERLRALLNAQGSFFIKTSLYPAQGELFDRWYYKRDPTHVQFYDLKTFAKLAGMLGMSGPVILAPNFFQLKALD